MYQRLSMRPSQPHWWVVVLHVPLAQSSLLSQPQMSLDRHFNP